MLAVDWKFVIVMAIRFVLNIIWTHFELQKVTNLQKKIVNNFLLGGLNILGVLGACGFFFDPKINFKHLGMVQLELRIYVWPHYY